MKDKTEDIIVFISSQMAHLPSSYMQHVSSSSKFETITIEKIHYLHLNLLLHTFVHTT